MNAAVSLCTSGAAQLPRQDANNGAAGAFITHSAHLPALDSDGAAVLPAPRRAYRITTWANALTAGLKRLSRYGDRGFTYTSPQTSADICPTAPLTALGPMPDVTPQSALYNTLLRRGLMIHNRNRDKAERWAAAHMAMHNRIYSGADE